jgi:hypothetical protein
MASVIDIPPNNFHCPYPYSPRSRNLIELFSSRLVSWPMSAGMTAQFAPRTLDT